MFFRTDNPVADYNRYEAEQRRRAEHLPTCVYCGEKIQTDYYYQINGNNICPECMDYHFRQEIIEEL